MKKFYRILYLVLQVVILLTGFEVIFKFPGIFFFKIPAIAGVTWGIVGLITKKRLGYIIVSGVQAIAGMVFVVSGYSYYIQPVACIASLALALWMYLVVFKRKNAPREARILSGEGDTNNCIVQKSDENGIKLFRMVALVLIGVECLIAIAKEHLVEIFVLLEIDIYDYDSEYYEIYHGVLRALGSVSTLLLIAVAVALIIALAKGVKLYKKNGDAKSLLDRAVEMMLFIMLMPLSGWVHAFYSGYARSIISSVIPMLLIILVHCASVFSIAWASIFRKRSDGRGCIEKRELITVIVISIVAILWGALSVLRGFYW